MAIRLSGMTSGLDTDSVVQALMSAQKYKKTKIENSKTKLEWKKELWSEMNTKVYDFYKSSLSKMRMQTTFKTKAVTSSDVSKVTATVNSSAAEGTYRVKVKSVASAQYVTSGQLGKTADGKAVTTSTKLMDIRSVDANGTVGGEETNSFKDAIGQQITFTGNNGAKTSYLLIEEDTTVADFLSAAKRAGINATFDATQNRIFMNSSTSGADQKFTITVREFSDEQKGIVENWKNEVGYDWLSKSQKTEVTRIFDGLQAGTTTYSDAVGTKLSKYVDIARGNAVKEYVKQQVTDSYNVAYINGEELTEAGAAAVKASLEVGEGESEEEKFEAMSSEEKLAAVQSLIAGKVKEAMGSEEVLRAIDLIKQNGVQSALDALNGEEDGITFDSDSGYEVKITFAETETSFLNGTADGGEKTDEDGNEIIDTMDHFYQLKDIAGRYYSEMQSSGTASAGVLGSLGLDNIDGGDVKEGDKTSNMVVVKASDALVEFNGATLNSSNSVLSINGLSLNILDTTDSDVTITVSKDTSAVYDAVKDFISEYNSVLKSMNTSYYAASTRGYDVLTDEMKEEMTDDEIEKWENVVKSSLLRRDDTLSGLITSFRNSMMGSYRASDGKQYSLASLGIMTSSDYTEKGLLHLMGDEDDDIYADSTNKLQNMLNKNPDLAMEIVNGLTNNLYQDLSKRMRSSKYSSALTFYNDKQMTEQVRQYKKDIATWEVKLADMEERYYSQFTAMEKAMANLQSQQNSLTGFFG